MQPENFGILILGHGSPEASDKQEFLQLLSLVRKRLERTETAVAAIEAGFLEFGSPTIPEALAALVDRGVRRVAAVPVFLAAAGHTTRDLPPALSEAARSFPHVQIELKPHVGSHENLAVLSALRCRQALEGLPAVGASETLLLLAAHGSPEPEAFSEWEKIARKREKYTPEIRVETCFAVLGRPQIADILPPLLVQPFRRIIVQLHFLLRSRLYKTVCESIEPFRKKYPRPEWIVAQPLGIHPLLAEAVVDLAMNVGED
jgi:precorrin-8X/cobalt-precorrin-8 methylmutase